VRDRSDRYGRRGGWSPDPVLQIARVKAIRALGALLHAGRKRTGVADNGHPNQVY